MIQKCLNMEISLPPPPHPIPWGHSLTCIFPEFSLLFCVLVDTPIKYVLSCSLYIKCVFIALQVVVLFFSINLEDLPLVFF